MAVSTRETRGQAVIRWILGLLTAISGTFFLIGGAVLLSRDGSAYYLIMGLGLIVSAYGLSKRRAWGADIYMLALAGTVIWSVFDAGWEFWPLFSRIFAFAVLGFFIALLYPKLYRKTNQTHVSRRVWLGATIVLAAAIVVAFAAMFWPKGVIKADVVKAKEAASHAPPDWIHPGGNIAGERFSTAELINTDNVQSLEVAWISRTGRLHESEGSGAEDQNTPQQINDSLYLCTAYGEVFSLDPDTGQEQWSFDPDASSPSWQRCRGLGYYEVDTSSTTSSSCERRLFLPTIDARLIALDAETGQPCPDFGQEGTVDLTEGMGHLEEGWYKQTSPPLVADNLVIVGGRIDDSTNETPGVVRAFHALTGELVWAWDPGNPSINDLPPDGGSYTRNTPNVWAALSYDPDLGLVYMGTGNATPTFYGGDRTQETDDTSSSIVALDFATGSVRWQFQTVYHDLWDFDVPAQPVLTDIPDGNGGSLPALIQVTKQGEIFMLNRETGEPIAMVEERAVPAGNVPGEHYSPVQPYSAGMPSIGNEVLTESDMWGATAFDLLLCRIAFKGLFYQGVFTPPGLEPALQYPGSLGGMNWGGASVDPSRHYMFVNDMRLGLYNFLIPHEDLDDTDIDPSAEEMNLPFGAKRERFLSPLGIPCQKPPFGTLTAIDLVTRQIVWQTPVGTVKETGPFNLPMHLPIPIGMPTLGPSLATQGGLVFFAGTQDFYLRAWDSATGEQLWKGKLPVGSQGGPMTYISPRTGRQYVVVTAGGARLSPERGDYVIAFALHD